MFPYPEMNRAEMMRTAHAAARKIAAKEGLPYRQALSKALSRAWRIHKADIARFESNVGLPIRSCIADRKPALKGEVLPPAAALPAPAQEPILGSADAIANAAAFTGAAAAVTAFAHAPLSVLAPVVVVATLAAAMREAKRRGVGMEWKTPDGVSHGIVGADLRVTYANDCMKPTGAAQSLEATVNRWLAAMPEDKAKAIVARGLAAGGARSPAGFAGRPGCAVRLANI